MNKLETKITSYGNWALITGASSGIGQEFALRLAIFGINLVIVARRKDRLEKLAKYCKEQYNTKSLVLAGDLTDTRFLESILDKTKELDIGILINNAGIGYIGEFVTDSYEHSSNMVKLNCLVPTSLTIHFTKKMKVKRKGAVIFLGSTLSFLSTPLASLYSATKSFNTVLGSTLWAEMKDYNIDVLSLNPGGTNTEFDRISKDDNSFMVREPSDVVSTAIRYLGKKESVVDGYFNKFLVVFSKVIPNKILVKINTAIVKKMIKDDK